MKIKTIIVSLLYVLLGHFPALIQAAPTAKRDLNGDGKADVVWRNFYTGENYVYPMDGKQILPSEGYVRTVADQNWNLAGVGDFNGDGKADLLWRSRTTGQNYVYFMNGTQIASEGYLRTVADSAWQIVGIGDFDNDNRDDILWRNSATGENYIYLMDGLTIKPTEGYTRTVSDLAWQVAGVGDADGDGNADIFWRNSSTGENYFYPMSETTVLGTEGYLRRVQDLNWTFAGVGDMNGDGTADILWRNGSTGENYLYPMSGTAILSGEGYIRTVADRNWRIVMVADLDGNGTADILWRNAASGENYIYFMDGSTILPTEGFIRSVAEPSWQLMPYANAFTKRAAGGDTITAVARSSTKLVALTDNNAPGTRVLTSTDGISWAHPAYTGSPSFGDIVFGNNLFVAVGNSPVQVATSPDGVTWTTRLNCFGCDDLYSAAWSGSAFVAVGEAGIVRRSSDGISWTAPTTPPPLGTGTFTKLRSVASSGTTFVAAGADSATFKGAIVYSLDAGVTWSSAAVTPVSDFEFDNVAWDGTRFLATSWGTVGNGGIWSSTDGTSWARLTPNLISRLTPTPSGIGTYIGTNAVGVMKTSTDAIAWTDRYDFVHQPITDVLWMQDRGEYLAVGGGSSSGFIATSTDAVTWNARYTSDRRTSVLWDGGRFVSIDIQGRVHTSSDGVSWASNQIIPAGGILRTYNDIVWSGTRYVAVGLDQIISSADGSNWGNAALRNLREFVAATWNGTEFAAITRNGHFFRSTDGINWPVDGNVIAPSPSLTDLAWSDTLQRYVAVASGGKAYFSDNGTSWTARSGVTTNNLRSVIWAGSQFVAVGDAGTILTSPDGDTWTNRSISGPTFNAVAFVNGQLIAAGSSGRIFLSSDGISWFESPSGTTRALFAIAASPTRVVAMGDAGDIVSRP